MISNACEWVEQVMVAFVDLFGFIVNQFEKQIDRKIKGSYEYMCDSLKYGTHLVIRFFMCSDIHVLSMILHLCVCLIDVKLLECLESSSYWWV
jgi:hypothetical protein